MAVYDVINYLKSDRCRSNSHVIAFKKWKIKMLEMPLFLNLAQ